MPIMGCYQDKRAIENELGGKWVLFDTVEFDETVTENLLYDKDLDNETPLNLNGVMFLFKKGSPNAQTNFFKINNEGEIGYATSTTSYYVTTARGIVKNGVIIPQIRTAQATTTASPTAETMPIFANNITSFSYRGTFYSGDKLEIYVLRGV